MGINDPSNKAFAFSKNNRWYDKYPNVKKAFDELKFMPTNAQDLFGQIVLQFYEYHQQRRINDRQNLSVGADKALALWKTRTKRRAEDKVPLLYRALMTLYLMEDPLRSTLAFRIADGLNALSLYARLCKKKYQTEDDDEKKELFKIAAESGEKAARSYLLSLGFTQEEIDELESDERIDTDVELPPEEDEEVPEWLKSDWGKLAISEETREAEEIEPISNEEEEAVNDFDLLNEEDGEEEEVSPESAKPNSIEKLSTDRIKLKKPGQT